MEPESKEYSWKWITASELLSHGACEFVSASQTSGQTASDATYYDGENDTGTIILLMEALANRTTCFCPAKPIYCRRGLYVAFGSNITGILVQWRELGHVRGEQ